MADLTAVSTVLSSIKAATDIAKIVRESGLTLEQAEYKLKLAELVEKLADAKLELASIQDVIDERDRQIKELKEAAIVKGKLSFDPPYYWLVGENGLRDGPFCQQCYDSSAKLIRLTGFGNGYWECKTCNSNYMDVSYNAEAYMVSRGCDHNPYS
ncbi:hypothetical protein [Denitromonas sp.]|uniref:hypothetical protein n=1 Tax=Denitromonas sp. TaxID=2734609 RepID=UPI002AFDCC99|nr:hypothetical protein [Denitromonas sp.]